MDGIDNPYLVEIKEQKFKLAGEDYSSWAEFSKLYGKRMYLQLGVNYQITNMRYSDKLYAETNYKISHRGIYPNILLQYMINAKREAVVALAYKYDFSLPNYGYYSPLAVYQTENLYSIGNQQLDKETFHTVETNYHLGSKWTFTYRLRYGENLIHIMTHQDSSNPELFYTQPENVGTQLQNYFSISYNRQLFTYWNSNNRLFLRNINESMPEKSIHNTTFGWNLTQQIKLVKNMGLTFTFAGETAQKRLSYETGAAYSVDAGGYLNLLKKNMYINLSFANILYKRNELTIKDENREMYRIDL